MIKHALILVLPICVLAVVPEARSAVLGGFDAVVAANAEKYLNALALGFGCF